MSLTRILVCFLAFSLSNAVCLAQSNEDYRKPAPSEGESVQQPGYSELETTYEVYFADPIGIGVYVVYELIDGEWIPEFSTPIRWEAQAAVMRARYRGGNPRTIELEDLGPDWFMFRATTDPDLAVRYAVMLESLGYIAEIEAVRTYPRQPGYPRP